MRTTLPPDALGRSVRALRRFGAWAVLLVCGLAQAAYPDRPITLVVPFAAGGPADAMGRTLARAMSVRLGQEVIEDYLSLRLSLRAHPMELLRPGLPESLPHDRLPQAKGRVTITGLVITRQRPGTASGVIFLTLEDETGTANVVIWKKVYEAFRKAVIAGRLVRVMGRIERDGAVTHLIAERIEDVSTLLATLGRPVVMEANDGRADETKRPVGGSVRSVAHHPRAQAKKLFPSRDFH